MGCIIVWEEGRLPITCNKATVAPISKTVRDCIDPGKCNCTAFIYIRSDTEYTDASKSWDQRMGEGYHQCIQENLGLWDNFPLNCQLANKEMKNRFSWNVAHGPRKIRWAFHDVLISKGLLPLMDQGQLCIIAAYYRCFSRFLKKARQTFVKRFLVLIVKHLIMFIAFHRP